MDPQTDVPSPASLLCAGALPIIHCTLACRPWLRPAALLGYTLLCQLPKIPVVRDFIDRFNKD